MAVLDTFNIMLVGRLLKARSGAELAKYDLCYGLGGMVAPYIAILVHKHSWDVLATVDLILAAVVVRRRACIGSFAACRKMASHVKDLVYSCTPKLFTMDADSLM